MATEAWEWANDSPIWLKPRRTVYFLIRHTDGEVEYRRSKRNSVITYATREQATRMAEKLNRAPAPKIGVHGD
jgi:hypothetical protein